MSLSRLVPEYIGAASLVPELIGTARLVPEYIGTASLGPELISTFPLGLTTALGIACHSDLPPRWSLRPNASPPFPSLPRSL